MKRVLIITYNFFPDNVVSARRPESYAKYLPKHGYEVNVLTLRFDKIPNGNDKYTWALHDHTATTIIDNFESSKVIRVPRVLTFLQILIDKISKFRFLRKLTIPFIWANGYFDLPIIYSYQNIKNELFKLLSKEKYDLIYSIYSPHILLKIAYEANKKFGIPYALDFRDLWNNNLASLEYQPSNIERIQNFFIKKYWSKWLSNAKFFSITSNEWLGEVKKLTQKTGYVLTNGFESEQLLFNYTEKNDLFTISFVGSLYTEQNIDIFINGVTDFIDKHSPVNLKINFVGLKDKYRPGVKQEILNKLDRRYLNIIDYVEKEEAYKIMNSSSILYYPAFSSIPGWCSVKVYEYLASKRPILVSPGDNGIVDDIIIKTKAGEICNLSSEVYSFISSSYAEWEKNKYLKYNGIEDEIEKYSRKYQVNLLNDILRNHL
ncbi:glycosyltransferase [Sabulibacter ruber]|uniref:glycosyltransferase n=1 Tax=Sabulibacter ruber TaxID=2811901 RepID=UPI001A96E54F|nr:glycosyltransferase [Sabulibacter ruber]